MSAVKHRRWMKSVLAEAKTSTVQMPWARGVRRAEMIARRKAEGVVSAPRQSVRSA